MTLELILGIALFAVAMMAAVSYQRMRAAIEKYKSIQGGVTNQDSKLGALRQEIGTLKEELTKRNRALEEARENARKKLRREGQKSDEPAAAASTENTELERLRQALKAMEAQVNTVKQDGDKAATTVKTQLEQDHARQVQELKDQVKALKQEVAQRGESRKKAAKMAGVVANLETLPPDVVSEFARLARKAEQHEKLHSLAQGKFQLAQERFTELQKRYFAVCRELALAIGRDGSITDQEARDSAEELVKTADIAAQSSTPEQ